REHGPHFASRAPRNVDELEQFVRRAALEAFGDIVGDGQRGTVELVAKTAAGLKRFILQEVFGLLVKPGRLLPDREVFETLIGHIVLVVEGLRLADWTR